MSSTLQMRHQQRENIRLKLVVSDEGDAVFGDDSVTRPTEFPLCPSSSGSLSMCYVNEAAFDDEDDVVDDDGDGVHCYREQPGTGPLSSPDLIAGMRRAARQKDVLYKNDNQPSAELDHKESGQESRVCS